MLATEVIRKYLQKGFANIVIILLMSTIVTGAPLTYDNNTILCDNDFVTNSLTESEIQSIFDSHNSFFKDYTDPTTGKLASWVIADRANYYKISSRVILAKMQSESSSVWSYKDMNVHKYNKDGVDVGTASEWVLFYGWPDTGYPDPKYKGFYNQVDNAAKSLSEWFSNPESKGWKVGVSHSVSDGTVTPSNRATAALYIYTPWIESNKLLYDVWKMMFGSTGCSSGLMTTDLNSGLTPTDLVNKLLGPGIEVSNVKYYVPTHVLEDF